MRRWLLLVALCTVVSAGDAQQPVARSSGGKRRSDSSETGLASESQGRGFIGATRHSQGEHQLRDSQPHMTEASGATTPASPPVPPRQSLCWTVLYHLAGLLCIAAVVTYARSHCDACVIELNGPGPCELLREAGSGGDEAEKEGLRELELAPCAPRSDEPRPISPPNLPDQSSTPLALPQVRDADRCAPRPGSLALELMKHSPVQCAQIQSGRSLLATV
jgi:hypothetical protein